MAAPFVRADGLVTRFDAIKNERSVFEQRWETIRRFQRPDAAPFLGEEFRGSRFSGNVYDNTAEIAADMAAAGIGGLLTGSAEPWHGWKFEDEALAANDDAKRWLGAVQAKQMACYRSPRSRFGLAMDSIYQELIDFANACLFIHERPGELPLFLARPLSQIYWVEDEYGRIDTVFWQFKMSARQAARIFGLEVLPAQIAKAAEDEKRAEEEFTFLHAVYPAGEAHDRGPKLGRKPIQSRWIAYEDRRVVSAGGYRVNPYIPFRWRVRAGERYARGPSDKALPDNAVLQQVDRLTLRAIEKMVDPALMLPDDGVVGAVGLRSADTTYVRPEYFFQRGDPIRPIQSGGRPDLGEEAAEARRQRIKRAMLSEVLETLRDPRATATQVLEVREEQYRHMMPVIQALEVEALGPLADRTFDLMLHGGRLPQPPAGLLEALAGSTLEPSFQSPMARAQALGEVRGMSQLWDMGIPLAQAGAPEALQIFDFETAMRHAAETLNVPYTVIYPPDVLQRRREQAAQERREAIEREAVKDLTTGAKNVAPFLKAQAEAAAAEQPAQDVSGIRPEDFALAA